MRTHTLAVFGLAGVLSFSVAGCGDAGDAGASDSGGQGGDTASGGSAAASGGQGSGGGPTACAARPGGLALSLVSLEITNPAGEAPKKGDALRLRLGLTGSGLGGSSVQARFFVTSARFSDYVDVPLGSVDTVLCEGSSVLELTAGPFLDDEATGKHFALGSGGYTISRIELSQDGEPVDLGDLPSSASFEVETSGALLVPVMYNAAYFEKVEDQTTTTPEAYLVQAFTRPHQLFTPSGADPDGAGAFVDYAGGFDEMMGVTHHFRAFPGYTGASTTTDGDCEDAAYYGQTTLGLVSNWGAASQATQTDRHGFDYLIALDGNFGGGVACNWLDVQVSGLINQDLDRQQIVAVHESGHIFGAPHCDDVGNGSGGPLQGYVMCSGEKHANYPGQFVFHSTSRAEMSSKWN